MSNLPNLAWQHVYFEPWVGKNYASQNFKIMMLGHSHYLGKENYGGNTTLEALDGVLFDGWAQVPTFSKAEAIVSGKYTSPPQEEFWNTIVYSVFLQNFIGNSAQGDKSDRRYFQGAGKAALIEKSRLALQEVLEKYTPHLVIVWAKETKKWFHKERIKMVNNGLDLWTYEDFPQLFWCVKHPSRAYKEAQKNYSKVKDYVLI